MDFKNLVIQSLNETTVMGGINSAMGSGVINTADSRSGDKYATDDARMVTSLYGGVITRRGMKPTNKNKPKKGKKKR